MMPFFEALLVVERVCWVEVWGRSLDSLTRTRMDSRGPNLDQRPDKEPRAQEGIAIPPMWWLQERLRVQPLCDRLDGVDAARSRGQPAKRHGQDAVVHDSGDVLGDR